MKDILIFEPVFKEKLWGGTKLNKLFGYDFKSENTGESWLISAHRNGRSKVINGLYKGMYLDDLYTEHKDLFDNYPSKEFPLLTKIIDANDVLSVQVHPNDLYAKQHANDLGKTECWYILESEPGSQIILGHHAQTKKEFEDLINQDKWSELLVYKDVKVGDFIYVPAGTLHAIGKGIVILETMQSSDTTYRVYDFDRQEKDGSYRTLHLKESIEVSTIPHEDVKNDPVVTNYQKNQITRFISNEFFTVEKWIIKEPFKVAHKGFKLFSVIKGSGTINGMHIQAGIGFISTSYCTDLSFTGDLELIASYI